MIMERWGWCEMSEEQDRAINTLATARLLLQKIACEIRKCRLKQPADNTVCLGPENTPKTAEGSPPSTPNPLIDDGTGDSFQRFSGDGLETIIQRAWEEMHRRAHTRAAFDLIQKARKELAAAGSDWVLELKGND